MQSEFTDQSERDWWRKFELYFCDDFLRAKRVFYNALIRKEESDGELIGDDANRVSDLNSVGRMLPDIFGDLPQGEDENDEV